MTLEDLKKKKREELADIVLAQEKEINNLTAELTSVRRKLRDRNIKMEECGSIAEAAIALNEIMQSAQNAADIYLENIKRIQMETEEKCSQMEQDSLEKAGCVLEEAQKQAEILLNSAAEQANAAINRATVISAEKMNEADSILEHAQKDSENIRDAAVQYFIEMSNKTKQNTANE